MFGINSVDFSVFRYHQLRRFELLRQENLFNCENRLIKQERPFMNLVTFEIFSFLFSIASWQWDLYISRQTASVILTETDAVVVVFYIMIILIYRSTKTTYCVDLISWRKWHVGRLETKSCSFLYSLLLCFYAFPSVDLHRLPSFNSRIRAFRGFHKAIEYKLWL